MVEVQFLKKQKLQLLGFQGFCGLPILYKLYTVSLNHNPTHPSQ